MVHDDGTPLWCSEAMEGRVCRGDHNPKRHRIVESCHMAFMWGCPKCEGRVAPFKRRQTDGVEAPPTRGPTVLETR